MNDSPEHVHAASCEGDNGLVVTFPFASFAVAEGVAVVVVERAERGLAEHTLEALVAAVWPAQETRLAGLAQHRRHAGGRGECVGGAEAGQVACLGDRLGGVAQIATRLRWHGPHAGQAEDEGRIPPVAPPPAASQSDRQEAMVAPEQRLQLAVKFDEPGPADQRLCGKLADQPCSHALSWGDDCLLGRGCKRAVGERVNVGQATGRLQVAHKALLAGGAPLGMRHVTGNTTSH